MSRIRTLRAPRAFWVATLVCITTLGPATAAHAHRFSAFACVENGVVSGYAWLAGGTRPSHARFEVQSPQGDVLHTGSTDTNGSFTYTPITLCDHLVIVYAGDMHQARYTVPEEEIALAVDTSVEGMSGTAGGTTLPTTQPHTTATAPNMQALVVREVQKQAALIRADIARMHEARSLRDVLGGIGYLVGVAGIVCYVLTKRPRA